VSICFLAASGNAGVGALAITYLIICVIAVSLAIAWIIFPFIVISKFNELLKVAQELANDFGASQLCSRFQSRRETNRH
jgi:hypothetical protein